MNRSMKSKILFLTLPLLLAAGSAARANDFSDRDALTDTLSAADQAAIADAEQALDDANAALAAAQQDLTDAQAALTAAEEAETAANAALPAAEQAKTDADAALATAQANLDTGLAASPPLSDEEIAALQTAVADATTAADAAAADLAAAQADVDAAAAAKTTAQAEIDQANAAIPTAQAAVDQATTDLAAAQAQTEATVEFVANLSDEQVIALNRALNNTRHNGLQPDWDLAVLQRIIDEDLSNGEIQQLVHGFELAARFEQHATRFEAKAEATGNDAFLDKADRMRERGQTLQDKFETRIGAQAAREAAADAAADEVQQVAKNEAKKAAREAAREAAQEHGKKHGQSD
jgi:hypothetical protein